MSHKLIKHFEKLIDIEFHTFDVAKKELDNASASFCERCPKPCNYKRLHFYGLSESMRWDNKYIYYCPMDFIFIAVPIVKEYDTLESGVIAGPILMGDLTDFESTYGITHMETAKVNNLAELASALFSNRDSHKTLTDMSEFLNSVYRELESLPKSLASSKV